MSLASQPKRIDIDFLMQFEGFKEFRTRTKVKEDRPADEKPTEDLAVETPEERLETAFENLSATLRKELLERILGMHPNAFEKLIVDLMLGMGTGLTDQASTWTHQRWRDRRCHQRG